MTFEQYGSRSGLSFYSFPVAIILFALYGGFSFMKLGLEGINNQPQSEIIQFWKTDFTHYVIPI